MKYIFRFLQPPQELIPCARCFIHLIEILNWLFANFEVNFPHHQILHTSYHSPNQRCPAQSITEQLSYSFQSLQTSETNAVQPTFNFQSSFWFFQHDDLFFLQPFSFKEACHVYFESNSYSYSFSFSRHLTALVPPFPAPDHFEWFQKKDFEDHHPMDSHLLEMNWLTENWIWPMELAKNYLL